ncbi:MAG: hypothetical protein PHQ70_12360 [Arcobacter sp.]|jgi:hypothetical protein|uniref:hypothetical protein n=1 Tax=Arcobacter sp. TaxID=1872629 RepID=UPI00258C6692|nr:hypothetical protein [Arcobacter sp.]MDD3009640.1 hypothetical protein [Arcobacter sp.]MDY0052828.1 hypothetical protein [Aliarcobacter sp.]
MNLRQKLHQFCKENDLEDITCIIQFTLVNYVSSHKSENDWVYLSPSKLDSFIGIGEDKIISLLDLLAKEYSDSVTISYETFCLDPEHENEFCEAINLEDYEEDEEIELNCEACNNIHKISNINEIKHIIGYEGNRKNIIENLKISTNDIAREMIVMNTSDSHINKLANIIVSRLEIDKEKEVEAKNGLVKILSSVKDVTGLISGIGEDISSTTNSVRKIIEDFSGLSTIKDILK